MHCRPAPNYRSEGSERPFFSLLLQLGHLLESALELAVETLDGGDVHTL